MSSVPTMEGVGISNACMQKVMIKRPMTSTEAIDAINSGVVSLGCSACSFIFSSIAFANLVQS
jgi:hypothetical protein